MATADSSADDNRVEIAIAVVTEAERLLIGCRPAGVALAGYWEFPGGKVHAGELPAAAAVRECREETGIEVRVTGEFPTVAHDYEHARVRLHFFACAPVAVHDPLPERFRWVERSELARYQFPPANAELVALLASQTAE